MKPSLIIFIFSLLFSPSILYADINNDLNHFFNGLGFASNATNPIAYHGQEAGYYSGGSLYLRNQVRDVQVASLSLPGFRAGCGGIDMWSGGFSFINGRQLESVMKNVINNAGSYAFMLGMETYLPQEANIMKYLEDLQNKINQANINSCETGAALVGGLWPKTQTAQRQVCQTIGTSKGLFSDWTSARQGCGVGGQEDAAFARGQGDPNFQPMLLGQGNLVWQALMQNQFTRNDTQLAELMMSLSGSFIISRSAESTPEPRYLASLVSNHSLVKALLYGGTASIYACDSFDAKGCLNPYVTQMTVSPDKGLASQVGQMLNDMAQKIQSDQKLTEAEIGLLNSTRLPLYKMLNVEAALNQGQSIDVTKYGDLIASSILYQYLDESLQLVQQSVHQLNWPAPLMQQFLQGINAARHEVQQQKQSAWQEVSATSQLIAQTEQEERMLAGSLSSQLSAQLNFAGGLP